MEVDHPSPRRRRRSLTLLALVTAVAVGATGAVVVTEVVVPGRRLDQEYVGTGVQWEAPAEGMNYVAVRVADSVVVSGDESARVVSLADGRVTAKFDAESSYRGALFGASSRFMAAGDAVLVRDDQRFRLYGLDGAVRWEAIGDIALAHADDTTVLADCSGDRCTLTGYGPTGTALWTRDDGWDVSEADGRIVATPTLPHEGADPLVLPTGLVVPRNPAGAAPDSWDVLDVGSGRTLTTVEASDAGIVGRHLVTVRRDGGRGDGCIVRIARADGGGGEDVPVSCGSTYTQASGDAVYVADGEVYQRVDLTEREVRDIGTDELGLAGTNWGTAGAEGRARAWGTEVSGVEWGGEWWESVAESTAAVDVADRSVTLITWPTADRASEADTRVTVLDLATGEQTGQVRSHGGLESVLPLESGSAVVLVDDRLLLLGRPVRT